jgi:predicted Zn-dependent peptidase
MLGAVLHPALDRERVEAERPIIQSELSMYRDEPDSRCFTGLLEGLYAVHPVRVDIGGTAESVSRIAAEDLQAVHAAFYGPGRMTVAVVGDLDAEALLPLLEDALEGIPASPAGRVPPVDEPAAVVSARTEIRMDVGMPSFLVGIKDPSAGRGTPPGPRELAMRRRAGRLLFETLLGSTSRVFDGLYAEGLLTDSFGFHYLCEPDFAFLAAGGESPDPGKAADALLDRMRRAFSEGLDARAFDTQRKAAAGSFLRGLDSIEGCGLSALHAVLAGIDLFDYPEIYDSMVLESAVAWMRFVLDEDLASVSLVLPAGGV